MQRRWILVLWLFVLSILLVAVVGSQGPRPQAQALSPAPVGAEPAASPSRLEAVREGSYPAQLAGHTGAIRPDRHGPQRNDPAEGIPAHAYSPFDERRNREHPCPSGGCDFVKGQVLLKLAPGVSLERLAPAGKLTSSDVLNAMLQAQGVQRLEPVFPAATPPRPGETISSPSGQRLPTPDLTRWQRAVLPATASVYAVVDALQADPAVAYAEPDYLRKPVGARLRRSGDPHLSLLGPGTDPLYSQQWHLDATNVPAAWQWLEDNGYTPGGRRDIVVAVIDTGVDYGHPDLTANMWVNPPEFGGSPGVDDDGNGYVDDIYGADTVYPDGDPQDDHGHGTHVAGIIAAQAENGEGGVGVAYNVQLIALKAAQYSGILASSDIAEAIYYAVEKGADVINMSFGGYTRSQVEEDALAVAFGQAVLVAAAGNDGKVNLPCPLGRDMYPAAYNWVLGVMASTSGGGLASFSNYDCRPHDTHEYELMAPGIDVWSTLPLGQYAAWDGTSMAAPVVSGIAALLRTKWWDKDVYSSRFIMGQIAANAAGGTGGVANAYAALTVAPQPELSYLEHWLFDTEDQSSDNDDDGIVDAGETIDLAIVIRNHWGKADPVTVTLEAWAEGAVFPDPYVTMITDTVNYGAIGSFNQDDNGLIYDAEGAIVGVRYPFRLSVPITTPNDHVIPLLLTMECRNGLDAGDTTIYASQSRFYLIVQRGTELPRIIDEDMTLTPDYYWLVPDQTLVEAGTAVTVTPGTQIQFWSTDPSDPYSLDATAFLQVEGSLLALGTLSEPIEMFSGKLYPGYAVEVRLSGSMSQGELYYTRVMNPIVGQTAYGDRAFDVIDHSYFGQDQYSCCNRWNGTDNDRPNPHVQADVMSYSVFDKLMRPQYRGGPTRSLFDSNVMGLYAGAADGNVFLKNFKVAAGYDVSRAEDLGYECVGCDDATGRANNQFRHNAILNTWWDPNTSHWMRIYTYRDRTHTRHIPDNYWGTASTVLIDAAIHDYHDDFNLARYVYEPLLSTPVTTTYPFMVDINLSTAMESDVSIVGAEPVTFTVTFNRDMTTTIQPEVSFGPDVPMTDYSIHPVEGGWVDARTWVGTQSITPITGDGYQLIRVAGAVAADDPWLVTGDDAGRFRFEIITSGTEAMNLQATGGEGYVDLMWTQDDFDLLSGFNLYRSTTIDGTYTRLNASIIPPDQRAYRDTDVVPGQPYYYKFTVVKSDMSESDFSNIAVATPVDTIPPVISHTPLTGAPPGLPLTLYADVTDNVGVQGVTLHHRAIGGTIYSTKPMVHTTGDRYSATLPGSQMTSPGIEYYIEAQDGVSTVRAGRPDYPYQVLVEDRPVVTTISPDHGPASGGTPVTISGSNFKLGASVTFGGAVAGDVSILSSNQISCTTPPHFPETVDVTVVNTDTQSGTLLRGFTYQSEVASLSLPDTGGGQHDVVQVPINAANLQGLAAADLTVTFDPAVLDALGADTGTLTPGWNLLANTGTPGQVGLAMASTGGTVSGSGVLAYLELDVAGSPGMTSTLHFDHALLNDGAIPTDATDGSFAVEEVYDISGTVRFWHDAAGVPGVLLTLEGDRVYSGLSDAAGDYTVSGAAVDDYTLTPSKADEANGISAYDASLVLQHAVGLITLSGHQGVAADVNKSGAITSMDAFYILQKAVELIVLPFPGAGVVWGFDPPERTYTNLSGDQTGQDFTATLLGDVSGNWSASGAGASAGPVVVRVQGGVPDPGGLVTATVFLEPRGADVYSLDLALGYDPDVASALGVELGPLAEEWWLGTNLGQAGEVLVALAGAYPLSESGELLSLTFQMADPRAGSTPLIWTRGDVNEGLVPASLVGGWLGRWRVYLPLAVRTP